MEAFLGTPQPGARLARRPGAHAQQRRRLRTSGCVCSIVALRTLLPLRVQHGCEGCCRGAVQACQPSAAARYAHRTQQRKRQRPAQHAVRTCTAVGAMAAPLRALAPAHTTATNASGPHKQHPLPARPMRASSSLLPCLTPSIATHCRSGVSTLFSLHAAVPACADKYRTLCPALLGGQETPSTFLPVASDAAPCTALVPPNLQRQPPAALGEGLKRLV